MSATVTEVEPALSGFSGLLLRPEDSGYEEARRVYNGLIDKRPALIARCRGTADVVAAVAFARESGLEVSIRGAGHNVSGRAVADRGLMIDLSAMKGMHVDLARQVVRAQAGVTWGELNRETQLHGLAVTGGVISTTGIAGLTLGGGIGWLMPKYGLALDNLLSAEVVTADGRVLTASADENGDLFWGLRGGGGNFGVVTSFEYRLHPVGPIVAGGLVAYPFSDAGVVLGFYRDFTTDIPDELMVVGGVLHAPDGSGTKLAGIVVCHVGTAEQAEADLAPLRAFGSPVMEALGPMPYTAVNSMLDAGYPTGSLNYWKSGFVQELSDGAIETIVDTFASCPSPMTSVLLEHYHGEVAAVPVEATAFPHRRTGYNLVAPSVWLDPAETDANVAWTREMFAALEPFLATARYVNYLDEDDMQEDPVAAAYGPNYERLVQVKDAYDPTNLFRLNLNVQPTG
jgi:FAD/FMN-containing dehydrogenase